MLLAHSGLPEPRANLELARVAAESAPDAKLCEWAASDKEYLALVGTMGLRDLDALRVQANDSRCRVVLRWLESEDSDVAWIMRENLNKKRIAGVF